MLLCICMLSTGWLHSPDCPAHDVVHVQPLLASRIQQPVVSEVVVTLQAVHSKVSYHNS
jgi:hypothetical protein